jgi:hypothetical protein
MIRVIGVGIMNEHVGITTYSRVGVCRRVRMLLLLLMSIGIERRSEIEVTGSTFRNDWQWCRGE